MIPFRKPKSVAQIVAPITKIIDGLHAHAEVQAKNVDKFNDVATRANDRAQAADYEKNLAREQAAKFSAFISG